MPVITFMSDFGTEDHYVAAVKGKLLRENPEQVIVDISHKIKAYDISHAAVVLSSVFRDFPEGTVHLIAVDAQRNRSQGIAMRLEGHYFVGFDCGLLSMISDQKPDAMVAIDLGEGTFPIKDVLSGAVIELANGTALSRVGKELTDMETLFARQLKVTKREIAGHVVHVDHYGNLLTNISRASFEQMISLNGAGTRFRVRFGRESFDLLHTYFTDVDSGDCYVLFNSTGFLQIGINKGNAAQLLGLNIDSPVQIEFIN